MTFRHSIFLFLTSLVAVVLAACDPGDQRTDSATDGPNSSNQADELGPLTVGYVRQSLFYALRNDAGLETCFLDEGAVSTVVVSGAVALNAIEPLADSDDEGLEAYFTQLERAGEAAAAIEIIINETGRRFIYLVDDGVTRFEPLPEEDVFVDSGLLIEFSFLDQVREAGFKVCVTCTVQSGKRPEPCKCTRKDQTVCCYTEGCSPSCPASSQCPYTCNRGSFDCFEVCDNPLPFTDPRPFAGLSPGATITQLQ